MFAMLALATAGAGAATFTNDTLIEAADTTHDGQDVVVNGCKLTVNGPHSFANLLLTNSAILAHSPAPNGETNHCLNLSISGDVIVDASSRVDVLGLGYQSGFGPGAGGHDCQGFDLSGGGGYGGAGGNFNLESFSCYVWGGGTYGSETQPNNWGSGSGSSCGGNCPPGGPACGGGIIRLNVGGTLRANGALCADGMTTSYPQYYGGGSGGSIYVTAAALAGLGTISANGGNPYTGGHNGWFCAGGGGGRIAIYASDTNSFVGVVSVIGGGGSSAFGIYGGSGGAGTVYWSSSVTPPEIHPVLIEPVCSGTNFTFAFQTASNLSYTVEYNDDLGTTNWSPYFTLTGNGSLWPCYIPMTNTAQRFFRVKCP